MPEGWQGAQIALTKPYVQPLAQQTPGVVMHVCNFSSQELEVGKWMFKAILGVVK